jgi:hypothetical protein
MQSLRVSSLQGVGSPLKSFNLGETMPTMKTLWLLALVFSLLDVPLSAQTQELPETSGNAFLRICSVVEKVADNKDQTTTEVGYVMGCLGYVRGFTTGVAYEASFAKAKTKQNAPVPFCIPEDVENGQTVLVVLKYIRDNPADSNQPTVILIKYALGKAYPCPSN